jgi:hypothetical protein
MQRFAGSLCTPWRRSNFTLLQDYLLTIFSRKGFGPVEQGNVVDNGETKPCKAPMLAVIVA